MSDLASRRADYESAGLDVADVDHDPIAQWQRWYDQASQAACVEPNAFVLSTVDGEGWPAELGPIWLVGPSAGTIWIGPPASSLLRAPMVTRF